MKTLTPMGGTLQKRLLDCEVYDRIITHTYLNLLVEIGYFSIVERELNHLRGQGLVRAFEMEYFEGRCNLAIIPDREIDRCLYRLQEWIPEYIRLNPKECGGIARYPDRFY
jgi:hypothetical protein